MMFNYAFTRKPGFNFADGLTQEQLGAPVYEKIMEQHQAYVDTLKQRGLTVTELEPLDDYPDAYFIEDPAVVTPKVAVVTIPGAPSRRGEQHSLATHLERFHELAYIQPPGTVDGGDVLMVDNHFFIGVSTRTNIEGAQQLGQILQGFGHTWTTVPIANGLHLKSDVTYIGDNTLLISRRYAQFEQFTDFDKIVLNDEESYAANSLWLGDCVIIPRGFPGVRSEVDRAGREIIELDVSEARKMDGGLTCLSLRF